MSPCESCPGLCCQCITIWLSDAEAQYMNEHYANLRPTDGAPSALQSFSPLIAIVRVVGGVFQRGASQSCADVPPREYVYRSYFMERCPFLTQQVTPQELVIGRCSIYHSEKRPKACGSFRAGGRACRDRMSRY